MYDSFGIHYSFVEYLLCVIFHRWLHWTALKIRTVSYRDITEGRREQADYYCRKCSRQWTVTKKG